MADENPAGRLPWISLICGIAAWFVAGPVPFVPGIAAIIIGGIALGKLEKEEKKLRWVTWAGIVIGGLSILAILAIYVWVFLAFMRNPVAH